MSKMTGGDIVVRALEDEGVGFAFGIPGTGQSHPAHVE